MARAYLGKWDSIDLNERHVEHIGPEMPLGSIPSWSGIVEASAATSKSNVKNRMKTSKAGEGVKILSLK